MQRFAPAPAGFVRQADSAGQEKGRPVNQIFFSGMP
jgi:hypothetical protein